MIRRDVGSSGYEVRQDEGRCMIRLWSRSYEVILFLTKEEARQFLADAKKEWQLDD